MTEIFQDWIGKSVIRQDIVTPRLLSEFHATLGGYLFESKAAAPPGFHFGLAPAIPSASQLGADGAEAKGLFLPPIPFSRRMWAGGRIDTFASLCLEQQIVRRSTIASIDHREGKAGAFYLVSIRHEIEANGRLALRDRQDLVFREGGRASPGRVTLPPGPDAWAVEATPTLLFRFSAFTFNGHRIHYDLDFARNEEGYDGLLVHGPLQATLLLNCAATKLGQVPKRFEYRCLAPLTSGQTFHVDGGSDGACCIVDARGVTTSEGRVPETE